MSTCSRSSGNTVDAAVKDDNIDEDVQIFIKFVSDPLGEFTKRSLARSTGSDEARGENPYR